MNSDLFWHSFTGSALIAAALTLVRLLFDYLLHANEQRAQRKRKRSDVDVRFERFLEVRLAEVDRRLEQCECDLRAERERSASLEEQLIRLSGLRRGSRK
jgi:hypothetical protein